MRAIIQRVTSSSVKVDGKVIGQIGKGFNVLLGIKVTDTQKDLDYIVDKVTGLRIFEDENEKLNLSIKEVGGEILLISQFTLYGDCRRGKRPSFTDAKRGEEAIALYENAIKMIRDKGIKVETGEFGADMKVSIENDGPVTILLDSEKIF